MNLKQLKVYFLFATIFISINSYQILLDCYCLNGGLCVVLPNGYFGCSCNIGFEGTYCEKSKYFIYWFCLVKINKNIFLIRKVY